MTSKPRFFGFWLPVYDEESAREAVKMSGLPVLVMGCNAALLALISAVNHIPSYNVAAISAVIALILIVIAFRIRGGRAGVVPIMVILFGAFIFLNIALSFLDYRLSGRGNINAVRVTIVWIVSVLCAALALSGWRGWRWLRKNNFPTPY